MTKTPLTKDEFDQLKKVIVKIRNLPAPTKEYIEQRDREIEIRRREAFASMLSNPGTTYGEATNSHEIYNLSQEEFQETMSQNSDNIIYQCEVMLSNLKQYINFNEVPPPAFAMRIAIILRKRKLHKSERLFLETWDSKFGSGWPYPAQGVYEKLIDRLEKLKLKSI